MSNHVRGCILARPSSSGRRAQRFSHASINVTPRALHLKIDDNNLLHLPRGVWPARQSTSQSVGAIDQQIVLADSWLLAVPASVGVVRFGSTWTRRSTLDSRCDWPLPFSTQFIQSVAVFGALHLLLTASCPVARGPLPLCPWLRTASHCDTPLLLPQDNNKRLHFAATKLRHKFRHFVASLCSL